jgi:hypothetical protein
MRRQAAQSLGLTATRSSGPPRCLVDAWLAGRRRILRSALSLGSRRRHCRAAALLSCFTTDEASGLCGGFPCKCAGGRGVPNASRRFPAHQAGVARLCGKGAGVVPRKPRKARTNRDRARLERPEISGHLTYCNSDAAIFRRRACAESDTGVVGEDHLAADGESVGDRRVVVVEVAMKCWSSTMGAPSRLPKRR